MQPEQLAEQVNGYTHGRDRSVHGAGCSWNMQSLMPTAQSLYVAVDNAMDKITGHNLARKTVMFLFLYGASCRGLPDLLPPC
jgi:hypothetical protein